MSNSGIERKAQVIAQNAYFHITDHLRANYETLTDFELNNMIHNKEQLASILEGSASLTAQLVRV